MNRSPLLGRPGAMWASLCVSSVCMHLSSVSVSLPPLRALSLGPGPAGLCLRVPLTLVPLPLAVRAGPRSVRVSRWADVWSLAKTEDPLAML